MPVCAGTASGSVFASSITIPERQPFVTHSFWPVDARSRRRRARRSCGSPGRPSPACGSVIENEARSSIEASCGRSRSRCSSVPWRRIIVAAMKEPLRIPESVTQPRESSITISAYVSSPSPRPPYSSGIVVPKSPISLIVSTIASGNSSACSSSEATGTTSRSTNVADGGDDLGLLGRQPSCRDGHRLPQRQRRERCRDVVVLLEREKSLLEPLDAASSGSASDAFSRNFSRTSSAESGFSGPPFWYGKSCLERRPVREPHDGAAGERLRVGRVVARLVAHLRGDREHAPGRRSPRR